MSKIAVKDLASYIVDSLDAGVDTSLLSKRIAAFLIEEKRSQDLTKLFRLVSEELSRRGSDQVLLVSARSLNSNIKNELAKLLTANNPVFTEVIDKSVIGGVKARSGELEIDLSLKSRLIRFKNIVARSN